MVVYAFSFYAIATFLVSKSSFRRSQNHSAAKTRQIPFMIPAQQQLLYSSKAISERPLDEIRGQTHQPRNMVDWIIRPATIEDRDGCAALIQLSYSTLLPRDYSDECLAKCLPLITTPREQLLSSNTWFVVEHPSTREIVGCGGWTQRSPLARTTPGNETRQETVTNNGNITETAQSPRDPDVPAPHLRHFATHPGYARMGIASSIWQKIRLEISKQFSAQGQQFPAMEVFSTLTAEGFYASCGFEVIDRFDMTLGKDAVFPVILMRRRPDL